MIGRHARRRMTGLVRGRGMRALTRFDDARIRAALERPAVRRAAAPLIGFYERAPIPVAAGLAQGLLVSTRDLPVGHAHTGAILRGTLEPPVQEALRRTLPRGGVLYDVGANVGFFTLLGARTVGEGGRVVAFEPVPWCARAVRRNLELNGLGWAEVREAAVSDHTGTGRLLVVGEASWSHLATTGRHADVRDEVDVALVALDDLAGELPRPDVVKIDTEGAELQVLDGMPELLAEHRPKLIVELHDTNVPFAERMEALGYRMANLDGPEPVREAPPGIHVLAEPG